jgi:hypothetical protein
MNEEALKLFSADLAKELKAKLQDQAISDFVTAVKASGDDRSFEVVMSTSDEDRQGDSLDQATWDFKYFDMNPVVLFAHNYSSFPIGIITDIKIDGDKAVATGKFAPAGINPDADMACALYQQKILRAVSPGYIQNDDGTRELLEVSFCPVPAGRYALSMRQVSALGVSTRDLVTKGFFYEEKKTKEQQIGDPCELEDGTPGTLADDPENPGTLICVPTESKAQDDGNDANDTMNDKLTKALKIETTRHGEAIGKSIEDFSEKSFDKDGNTPNDTAKEIDEFEKSIDGEHAEHLDKTMKAIDDNYELEDQKKSIDEFKSAMKGEHMEHVKCFDKAIAEFKDAWADGDDSDRQKAIDDFTTKSAAELGRHDNAQRDLVKAEMGEGETDEEKSLKNKGEVADELAEDDVQKAKYQKLNEVYDIFYAFTSAYMEDSVGVDDFEKLLDEAVALMKGNKEKGFVSAFIGKSNTVLPVTIKEKIGAVITTLEAQTEREESTNIAIASLKELTGSPQEDKGEEQKSEKTTAPKQRSSPPVATEIKGEEALSEFESFMLTRKVLKAVYQSAGEGLAEMKKALRERYPDRR